MTKFDVKSHIYVPEHKLLTNEESQKILEKYNITPAQLPRILISDPAIEHLNPEIGNIIKIIRKSPTVGKTEYYRVVVNA